VLKRFIDVTGRAVFVVLRTRGMLLALHPPLEGKEAVCS